MYDIYNDFGRNSTHTFGVVPLNDANFVAE